jgi:hypothetical protein
MFTNTFDFGVSFNQPINKLPQNLMYLKLPDRYGDKIEDINFPPSLRCIVCGNETIQV